MLNLLKICPLFNGLKDAELNAILALGSKQEFKMGDYLLKENDKSDRFFIIQTGTVEIIKNETKKNRSYQIRTLTRGDVIGEVGLVVHHDRTASVRALTPVTVFAFAISEFQSTVGLDPYVKIEENLSNILIDRLGFAYKVTIQSMRNELAKKNQIIFYQALVLILIAYIFYEVINPMLYW